MSISETYAFLRQAVDTRRLEAGISTVGLRLAVAHIIEENEDDVGPVSGAERRGGGQNRQQECYSFFHHELFSIIQNGVTGGPSCS